MTYSLSSGKITPFDGYGIEQSDLPPFESGRFDPRAWFTNPDHPFEIEIGTGKGTFLVQQATLRRERNYLGIENVSEFYRYAADRMRRRQLTNVRMLRADATEFLHYWCADAVADVIHLYFSDPWPKTRHHKRRVVQDRTLADFHRVLKPAGLLHVVTDHDELWTWCQSHFTRAAHLFQTVPFQPAESASEGEVVGTNFERKYRREGRPFHAITLRKRDTVA